ncbi:hypothetical protein, partial [Kistimonas scapharcae]|uniref:hypothetical protein n=1 Tax=Kistimonas scapharcae TaxID=1036133 RepID=UPI0031EAAEC8
ESVFKTYQNGCSRVTRIGVQVVPEYAGGTSALTLGKSPISVIGVTKPIKIKEPLKTIRFLSIPLLKSLALGIGWLLFRHFRRVNVLVFL